MDLPNATEMATAYTFVESVWNTWAFLAIMLAVFAILRIAPRILGALKRMLRI